MSDTTNLTTLALSGDFTVAGVSTFTGAITASGGVVGAIATTNATLRFKVQQLTASGAITVPAGLVQLNHATVIIAATLAAPTAGDFIIIWDDSASGTAAHTVTLGGTATWDGTHQIATFNAPGKGLVCIADSATRYNILVNIGTVTFT